MNTKCIAILLALTLVVEKIQTMDHPSGKKRQIISYHSRRKKVQNTMHFTQASIDSLNENIEKSDFEQVKSILQLQALRRAKSIKYEYEDH